MFVPATPALAASPLAPAGLSTAAPGPPVPSVPVLPIVLRALRVRHRAPDGPARKHRAHHSTGRRHAFRPALASWYGGGGSLACGGYLTSSTMGVANKTLPCGTVVTIRYGGRRVRVRVIDRGPYVEGREFDLTEATKTALGFEGVGEIWVSEGRAGGAVGRRRYATSVRKGTRK
jgi:Lytic transglycolase